ncbi:hypothetical protein LINPERPRIM_LOCUS4922 [Linum perenne]
MQTQLREVTLQEENAAYERAITNCETKIQEKIQEADLLQMKLQQKVVTEGLDAEAANVSILEKLEAKKKELRSMEEIVHDLERKWAQIQDKAIKQPTPAQREKVLDKQLHSLIEQLEGKQSQAESLVSEIHIKEMELERLNGLWKQLESNNSESNTAARNRYGRSNTAAGSLDYMYDKLPHSNGGRTEYQQRLVLMSHRTNDEPFPTRSWLRQAPLILPHYFHWIIFTT